MSDRPYHDFSTRSSGTNGVLQWSRDVDMLASRPGGGEAGDRDGARGSENTVPEKFFESTPQCAPFGQPVIHKNPSAVSWAGNRIDVFAVSGRDHELLHYWCEMPEATPNSWRSGGWHGPDPRGGRLADLAPCAVSWGRDRLDVFALGDAESAGTVQHYWWDGREWGGVEPLRQPPQGIAHAGPRAVSWARNRLDVFAVSNPDGIFGPRTLQHWWWDSGSTDWPEPESLGGRLWDVQPDAASRGPRRVDVVAIGDDGQLVHWEYNNDWRGPAPRGGSLANGAGPCVLATGPDRLDVFAVGSDQHLWHYWANGDDWATPEDLGGTLEISTPTAVSTGPGELHVFATLLVDYVFGPRHIGYWSYAGGWRRNTIQSWTSIGGPSAVARAGRRIDVFSVHDSNLLSGPSDVVQWTFGDPDYTEPVVVITSASALPDAVSDSPYQFRFTAAGGTAPYLWSVDGLPLDLHLNQETGEVSGAALRPNQPATSQLTVKVFDSSCPKSVSTEMRATLTVLPGEEPSHPPAGTGLSLTIVTPAPTAGVSGIEFDLRPPTFDPGDAPSSGNGSPGATRPATGSGTGWVILEPMSSSTPVRLPAGSHDISGYRQHYDPPQPTAGEEWTLLCQVTLSWLDAAEGPARLVEVLQNVITFPFARGGSVAVTATLTYAPRGTGLQAPTWLIALRAS